MACAPTGNSGRLIIDWEYPLDLLQAVVCLGATSAATQSIENVINLDLKFFPNRDAMVDSEYTQGPCIGVYTKEKIDAEALACVMGFYRNAEISRNLDSAFYHYHDEMRTIHIWFGEPY